DLVECEIDSAVESDTDVRKRVCRIMIVVEIGGLGCPVVGSIQVEIKWPVHLPFKSGNVIRPRKGNRCHSGRQNCSAMNVNTAPIKKATNEIQCKMPALWPAMKE